MGSPTSHDNRVDGKFFEDVFERVARYCGLFPKKTELSARRVAHGRIQTIKSELDFRLVDRDGRVGFFDAKNFQGDSFSFAQINSHQLGIAVELNDWNVPAGFVVWFREPNRIAYFPGALIALTGPGNSFRPEDGVSLGKLETLDLKPLLMPAAKNNAR